MARVGGEWQPAIAVNAHADGDPLRAAGRHVFVRKPMGFERFAMGRRKKSCDASSDEFYRALFEDVVFWVCKHEILTD